MNLRNAMEVKQWTEYHRLIREMVRDYGMQEEIASKISGVFWYAIIYAEPPISDDKSTQTEPFSINNVLMHDSCCEICAQNVANEVAEAEKTTVLGSKNLRCLI